MLQVPGAAGDRGTHLLHVLRDVLQPLEGRLVGCQHGKHRPEAGGDQAEVYGRGHAGWLAGELQVPLEVEDVEVEGEEEEDDKEEGVSLALSRA